MSSFVTIVGLAAAFCTTVSFFPQVRKCWKTHSTGDLSLKMILLLATGNSLWIVYGFMKGDAVIIGANVITVLFVSNLLFFKAKEVWWPGETAKAG